MAKKKRPLIRIRLKCYTEKSRKGNITRRCDVLIGKKMTAQGLPRKRAQAFVRMLRRVAGMRVRVSK